jgi:phospholipid/cholesterol/gamma-HCH transport system permease protein
MDDRTVVVAVDRPEALAEPPAGDGWTLRIDRPNEGKTGTVIVLAGDWIARDSARTQQDAARRIVEAARDRAISFDATGIGRWDSALLVFVSALRNVAKAGGVPFDAAGLPLAATKLLSLTAEPAPADAVPRAKLNIFASVGMAVFDSLSELLAVTGLVGETLLSGGRAVRGRLLMRGEDVLTCLHEAGAAALPIVTVVNLLTGAIVAFVGAVQLRRLGADIFVADLVGVAMAREMAAMMTAIVMSGRTGGAYAAQIATMLGNEEIDALRAFGIPVQEYLVLPRVFALTCMMPLLYLYGCAIGIFGGFLVAVSMLNLAPNAFVQEIRSSFDSAQILFGLVKSVTFGALIAIVGCRTGLRAGRSAADVGRAATTAVVIGIVGLIALDAVFAVCANALAF